MSLDAWRLAAGTLTVLPVGAPRSVTPSTARGAILLAPLAVLPLGIAVATVLWAGGALDLAPLAVGLIAVGVLALGTRALHWDGLSDVADGLTSSYDRERSLAVMKSGTSGPAGTVAVIVVLGVQAACLAGLTADLRHALLGGLLVCLSRVALWLVCATPVPGARPDGLGLSFIGVVPTPIAVAAVLLLGVVPALVVVVLIVRCVRRLGGVTGDVMGAAVETVFAALLLAAACLL
ncbi:adenosylcobinamide-GDP ribazoletransferase [Nocardioides sp. R-C-SC26]|uniref:adenosylcobinamide-GDP ribazoletransferase n=1 Tax=Nocardioides sp. R-C-SC26 TaxID=2870414 RepID=UPI001E3A32B3|nr:adenosylcobinamide-GDP ribazoletransferase [Nocardioides sp. R-C-SC26]